MPEHVDQATRPRGHDAVRVRAVLFGNLAGLLPAEDRGRTEVEVKTGGTVDDVLDALAVPPKDRSFLTLDGERVTGETPVRAGAVLRVIVPLGGG
jgi:sulfur carrier protein ThiS